MSRKRKNNTLDILVLIIVLGILAPIIGPLFLFANWLYDNLGLLIAVAVAALFTYFAAQSWMFRGIQIANIDSMTGIDFEQYLQKLLTTQGYNVSMTQASGDLGVDLVASKNGDKIAIQVKRYNTKISRRAISDAVAGMQHYHCNKAMVITNNYFTPGAVTLARSTGCILVDRDTLAKWIV